MAAPVDSQRRFSIESHPHHERLLHILSFRALQHRMVDLLRDIEQARSAVINAAAELGSEAILAHRVGIVRVLSRPCVALRLLIRASTSVFARYSPETPANTDLPCQT